MVIFYEKNGENVRKILMAEHDVMSPTIPANKTIEEKIEFYDLDNKSFISLPYELGGEIFNYNLCFNEEDIFLGLVPILNKN